ITPYHDDISASVLHKKVISILMKGGGINKSVMEMLDYSLYEVMDNVLTHSQSPTNGFCVTQLFRYRNQIRLMICDTGIGIHASLTQKEDSIYKDLSPEQSIIRCTEKGVTNGNGMGNGLYHTTEFVKQNKGELSLHSNNYIYKIIEGKVKSYHTCGWRGSYIYMKINTLIDVTHEKIIGQDSGVADNFEFLFGNLVE